MVSRKDHAKTSLTNFFVNNIDYEMSESPFLFFKIDIIKYKQFL